MARATVLFKQRQRARKRLSAVLWTAGASQSSAGQAAATTLKRIRGEAALSGGSFAG
jgi:hypothetical protein